MERINGRTLKKMFLPKLTPEGVKALSDNRHFVRCQLMHYGVQFDESEFSGNGVTLLQKSLQTGKCDYVPMHILRLQQEMYPEFLDKCTPQELADNSDWAMDKYFLSSGIPDPTKTTFVVGIVVFRMVDFFNEDNTSVENRTRKMIEAVDKIPGLHQKQAKGSQSYTIFIGWDAAAVEKAANEHAANEQETFLEYCDKFEEEEEDRKRERERERDKVHKDYLETLAQKKSKNNDAIEYSPVGSYIVQSEYLAETWKECEDNLRLDIHKTYTPGVFQANFEFGVYEGIMMICVQKDVLEEHCLEADRQTEFSEDSEGDDDEEEDEDSESEGRTLASGSKRKLSGAQGKNKAKKHQPENTQSLKYRLKIRCRETGEGEIQAETEDGTLEFADEKLASFEGDAGLPCWGHRFSFSALKISDVPAPSDKNWGYYSERRHNYEEGRRWR